MNFSQTADDLPLVTVITVVFNGEQFLEETIKSVISQTYTNIEYIIIDGGSTDCTLDIIGKYAKDIDYWVSEKDDGIYDAMNKGVRKASGQWVNFMNAGDQFFSPQTIQRLFEKKSYSSAIVYGSVMIKYAAFSRTQKCGTQNKLWMGMQFSHQSVFVDKILANYSFNDKNKIAADLEFFYGAYKKKIAFEKTDEIISIVLAGGLSDANRVQTILYSQRAILNGGGVQFIRLLYGLYVVDALFRNLIKSILPQRYVDKIIRFIK